ncbi:sodium:proton antiporter [Sediminibacillus dalangtanensis]|uniref:Sodium:proton antiporter n=1 Tax=Sediminibacillus dalangtanensis TaxID=2729421 RepID=A0ABX7VYM7_9BACI|nr:sodium:proton antiporter [Sediminibacillus dalangtanensis]QTN00739.1 sodium:proton antiporter [Sediminibacillus dalangtanensis]
MENIVLVSIVIILGIGIFSQWLAWRIQWPSIVIMSIAGLLLGPIFGLFNPQEALGNLYSPLISLAVAIVLFEGSSSLDIREIRGISKSVFRIVTFGAFIAWIAGSLAAHFIAGLSYEVSFIIGGLFVVTGPTVIIPLLRNAKLAPRIAAALKWEGIIVDPFGPLLALFAYEVIKVLTIDSLQFDYLLNFFFSALIAVVFGYAIGMAVSIMISKGVFPEYLKSPIMLAFVLICFTAAEVIMHETGMLAVTVMGLTLAKTKRYVSSIGNISHFVENISVMLTSTIFILLTASLSRETIAEIFTLPIIGFVIVMLFLVRPLSIWISTIGTELTLAEKGLIGWVAPRGVVALTVSGYFSALLMEEGHQGASLLTTLTFALVFITVCAHGFTLRPLAKALGLANDAAPGILIVGASSFSIALADYLRKFDIPVLISDSSAGRLQGAVSKDIPVHHGQILAEHTQYDVDLTPYETILAMTGDSSYNALVIQSYAPEFGYNNTFSLPSRNNADDEELVDTSQRTHLLFSEDAIFTELNRKINTTYSLQTISIKEKNKVTRENLPADVVPLFIKKEKNGVELISLRKKFMLEEGDQLVVLRKTEGK